MTTYYKPCSTCCSSSTSVTVDSTDSSVKETSCCTTPSTVCSSCNQVKCVCKTKPTCSCNPCSCKTTVTQYVPVTDENHCTTQVIQGTSPFYVKNTSAFSMPECGATTTVFIEGARRLHVGAILYADTVGYLKVVNINDDCSVSVENITKYCSSNCNIASAGSTIASCTYFGVGIPSCGDSSTTQQDGVYLASCYIIPAVESCVTIKVSRIGNITTGATISIAGYQYLVSDVIDSETIVICNEGSGGTPNTEIKADADCDNLWDYPIDVIDSPSPCTQDPVTSGVLVVCDGQKETILEGNIDNQIPVWNEALGKFTLEVLESSTIDCTILTSCLIIDPADPSQIYLITVEDSSIFEKPEYEQFQNLLVFIDGDPFTIVEVVSPTQVRVQPYFEVTVIKEYASGSTICVAECCLQCRPVVETLGRFGGQEGEPVEILIPQNEVLFSIPVGISVRNYFVLGGAGTTDPLAYDPTVSGLWEIPYRNDGACKRYIEIRGNFECVLDIPTGILGNIEYRTINDENTTQTFAAIPIIGSDNAPIADPDDVGGASGNLFTNLYEGSPYKNINTYKGCFIDRDFVEPGEQRSYLGHIRLTFNNTTGGPLNGSFLSATRVWYAALDYELGPIIT